TAFAGFLTTPDGLPVVAIIPGWFGPIAEGQHHLKALREFGDKVPGEVKSEVDAKVADVKKVAEGEDVDAIKAATQGLGESVQKIGGAVYQGSAAPEGEASPDPEAEPDVVEGEVKE
ncbi:MAG: hypothetical protein ABI621_10995, partial [Chloroflexota bacterium]